MELITHLSCCSGQKPRSPPCHLPLSQPQSQPTKIPFIHFSSLTLAVPKAKLPASHREVYGSSLVGLSLFLLFLQFAPHSEARMLFLKCKLDHATPLLRTPQWLPATVSYEICLIWALIFPALSQVTLPLAPMYPHPAEHLAHNKHATRLLNG